MSYSPYSTLRQRVLSQLLTLPNGALRTVEMANDLPGFVALAEQRLFHGGEDPVRTEPVRVPAMETVAALTLTDGTAALPADFLEAIRVIYEPTSANKSRPLYQPADIFYAQRQTGSAAPTAYTMQGTSIVTSPQPSGTLSLAYYARPAGLAADGDTNWLLQNAPALYYHAILAEAYRWLGAGDLMMASLAAYTSAVGGVNQYGKSVRFSGNRLHRTTMWG